MEKNNKMFSIDNIGLHLDLTKFLQEKEIFILFKLNIPVCYEEGFIDKNNKFHTYAEIKKITSHMTFDEQCRYFDETKLTSAGHRLIDETDLKYMMSNISHPKGFLDPSFIAESDMAHFINTFQYLTDPIYKILDEETCYQIQNEMFEQRPLTYEKLVAFRDRYITDEIIEKAAKKSEWQSVRSVNDVAAFIRKNIALEKAHGLPDNSSVQTTSQTGKKLKNDYAKNSIKKNIQNAQNKNECKQKNNKVILKDSKIR